MSELGEHEQPDATTGGGGPIRVVAGVLALVAAGFLVLLALSDGSDGGAQVDSRLLGELVPHVEGETFAGDRFDIDAVDDRWILVNFFASWCVPCEKEHPELIEFARRHVSDGLVVSIPFGDTERDARAFFEERGGDWPVVKDSEAEFAVGFGVLRPPESYLVAPGGTVVAKWQGQITADGVDGVIAELTGVSGEG